MRAFELEHHDWIFIAGFVIALAAMYRISRMQSWVFPATAFVSVMVAGLWFNGGEWYIPSIQLATFGVTSINLKSILFFIPVIAVWIGCFFIIWSITWVIGASARKTRSTYQEAVNAANRAVRNAQEAKQRRRPATQQAKASEQPRYEQPNSRIWFMNWGVGASARKTYRETINAANRALNNAQEAKQRRRAAQQQAKASEQPRYDQPNARPEQPQHASANRQSQSMRPPIKPITTQEAQALIFKLGSRLN